MAESPSSESSKKNLSAEDLQDQTLGEFRILRRLGKGGMAEVYLAEQSSIKRQVAIKVLRADLLDEKNQILIKRFEQEAKAAGGLTHPNIVQVYVVGNEEGIHYIAQEYVEGPNLKEFVLKKGPPDLKLALHIMRQTAAALQVAAEAGIVHRDIKPENIMLTRKGEVKVADFGLAQLSTNNEGVNLTQVGMTMGTPLYMSPEQIHGKKVDQRSDLYSFGVTCYHMLAGRPPFDGESPMAIAVKHLNEEPEPLAAIRSDLPVRLIEIVNQLMAKKIDDRPNDAGEVLKEIRKISKLIQDDPDSPDLKLGEFTLSNSQSQAMLVPPDLGKKIGLLFAGVIPVLLISAGVGWVKRTPDPFAAEAPVDRIETTAEETAAQQYLKALQINTLDAWQAVVTNFPNDPEYSDKARVQVLINLIRVNRLVEAEKLINEFSIRQSDTYALAVADAGKAILANLDDRYEESHLLISQINRAKLPEAMTMFLVQFEEKNSKMLAKSSPTP
ncbi:MAG: serine/threonine-protein kinase [Planctomycetaceae bacterium]|jgi:eukaryotic-like serine/threonine-protein kinase|nr:serine/threonine-protein kinase [Planctomycetaceae bacterium]